MCFTTLRALGLATILGLFIVGCADSNNAAQPSSTDDGTVAAQSDEKMVDCGNMSQKGCLNSSQCLLEQTKDKKYVCRAAQNDCEKGFIQVEGMAESSCQGNGQCKYTPASCFCPEGKQCICGGGAPAACQLLPAS